MAKEPFGFELPEDSPGFLLWQTTITWQRLIKKQLDRFDIAHAQFVILAILLWFEQTDHDVNQILIVRQSKLDKMTVSKALKKLVALEFVQRAEYEIDTRAKSVKLTAKGRAMAKKLVPIVEDIDAKYFGRLSKAEEKSLIAILNRLNVAVGSHQS